MHQLTRNIDNHVATLLLKPVDALAWNRPSAAILDKIGLLTNPLLSKISNRFKNLLSFTYLANEARNYVWNATTVNRAERQTFDFNSMTIELSSVPTKAYQLKSLLEKLCTIPAIKVLVQHAFQGAKFQVVFADRTELFSEGDCLYQHKTIRIAKNLSIYQIFSTLIFELCNAANIQLSQIMINDYENADDYALAIEKAEFATYQQHLRLLQLLSNNSEFTARLCQIGESPTNLNLEIINQYPSFAEYWEGVNRLQHDALSHSEYYRQYYYKMRSLTQTLYDNVSQTMLRQFTYRQPRNELAMAFTSDAARELLAIIGSNQNTLTIFNRFQKPLAACLAATVTPHSLQRFKALNRASQVYYLQEYIKRYNPLLKSGCCSIDKHKLSA